MSLFFIGLIEMVIATVWTKTVSGTQILASGAITFVNILIWYYVLVQIVDNLSNWQLVILYALGCAVGTVLTTWFYNYREQASEELDLPLTSEQI